MKRFLITLGIVAVLVGLLFIPGIDDYKELPVILLVLVITGSVADLFIKRGAGGQ